MGVDYYACSKCGETFGDCGVYYNCITCGLRYCEHCDGHLEEDEDSETILCKYCNPKNVNDDDMLKYFIEKSGKTKDEIVSDVLKERNNV